MGVQEALETAAFTKKRIAPVIYKLLTSAVDNAKYVSGEQGTDLDVDNLYVKTAVANDGPRMKRIRPAPMGRAYRYQRRLTHIVLSVAEREGRRRPGDQGRRARGGAEDRRPKAARRKLRRRRQRAKKAEEPKAETKAAAKTAGAAKKKAGKKA